MRSTFYKVTFPNLPLIFKVRDEGHNFEKVSVQIGDVEEYFTVAYFDDIGESYQPTIKWEGDMLDWAFPSYTYQDIYTLVLMATNVAMNESVCGDEDGRRFQNLMGATCVARPYAKPLPPKGDDWACEFAASSATESEPKQLFHIVYSLHDLLYPTYVSSIITNNVRDAYHAVRMAHPSAFGMREES